MKVTRRDVKDALLIAEILGGYREAFPKRDDDALDRDVGCLGMEHCPTCTCEFDEDGCGHLYRGWECVAAAIGATPTAEALYLKISNAVSDLFQDTLSEPAISRWASSLADEAGFDYEALQPDLEVASLLRDGLLPPGIVLTTQKSASKKRRS